jgi:hypothetical protein
MMVSNLPELFYALVLVIGGLIFASIFSQPIQTLVRRRIPGFTVADDSILLWGSLILTGFVFGLIVMYLLQRA